MSLQTPQDPTLPPGPVRRFGRAAVAVAAGAALSKRTRVGGALLLAGLAWLAVRRNKSTVEQPSLALPPAPNKINDLPDPALIEGVCEPSHPFLDDEVEMAAEPPEEDIRTSLMPPPSLFTPPSEQPEAPRFTSPLLQSAPTFVEVEEVPAPPKSPFEAGAAIPDTIAIPTTPDPPLGLLANSLPPPPTVGETAQPPTPPPTEVLRPLPPSTPIIQPKAGLQIKIEPTKPTEPLTDSTPPKRKSFLDWLRE